MNQDEEAQLDRLLTELCRLQDNVTHRNENGMSTRLAIVERRERHVEILEFVHEITQ